jgi:hypothetical protein
MAMRTVQITLNETQLEQQGLPGTRDSFWAVQDDENGYCIAKRPVCWVGDAPGWTRSKAHAMLFDAEAEANVMAGTIDA